MFINAQTKQAKYKFMFILTSFYREIIDIHRYEAKLHNHIYFSTYHI